jgi:hypothetical protein
MHVSNFQSIQKAKITMTIAIILGTRPEILKMAPVIRECLLDRL